MMNKLFEIIYYTLRLPINYIWSPSTTLLIEETRIPNNPNATDNRQLSGNDRHHLSLNPNDMDFEINWSNLHSNAQELINPEPINWHNLSQNPNPIELINPEPINWDYLSQNPNAIELLNLKKYKTEPIDYVYLTLKRDCERRNLHKDLIQYIFHPNTINKWLKRYYNTDIDDENYIDYFELYFKYHT